jgi:hypothetical protein
MPWIAGFSKRQVTADSPQTSHRQAKPKRWSARNDLLAIPAVCLLGLTPVRANAQPVSFTCPRAGTVVEYASGQESYLGTVPGNPFICAKKNLWGKDKTLIFNFYLVMDSDVPAVQAGMQALMANPGQPVSFIYIAASNRNQYKDTWVLLRREFVVLDGRKIDAVVFGREQEGRLGNSFHSKSTWWLDPRTGVWLKSEVTDLAGQAIGLSTAGPVIRIVEP